jgi:hypothetical protein
MVIILVFVNFTEIYPKKNTTTNVIYDRKKSGISIVEKKVIAKEGSPRENLYQR